MLLLREKQLAALADAMMVRQVRLHLRRYHRPQVQDIPFDTLTARIAFGITQARGIGLTLASSIAGFVSLMFTIAPDFYEHPSVRPLLAGDDPVAAGLDPDDRLFALGTRLTSAAWARIQEDGRAWPESVPA